ncbi:DUF5348 domain-containing protein [Paenibacillus sp. FSL R10-2791]|uniref:DUF5348 domain-containing protein n=1 Tax=Paenibacillus sp. FSL R10-2791 TaxID=2954695 RepID=UPI0030FC1B4D
MKEQIKSALANLEPQLKRVSNLIQDAENEGIYNSKDPEDQYLRGMFYKIADYLDDARRYTRQVIAPVIEEGILHKGKDGRYATGKKAYYTSGAAIEYLYVDPSDDSRWIYSHVEHNGNDYFIANTPNLPMERLKVRVKQLPMWD